MSKFNEFLIIKSLFDNEKTPSLREIHRFYLTRKLLTIIINLIRVVYTAYVINLVFIRRVKSYQILPIRTIFDTDLRFNA